MVNSDFYNALTAVRDIVTIDLLPLFDGYSVDYVPIHETIGLDWISFIKSPSFLVSSFVTESVSFAYFLANVNNYISLKNDSVAISIVLNDTDGRSLFLASPCFPLLPLRTLTIPNYNLEVMTGKIFLVSYQAYTIVAEYPLMYWELRFRSSGVAIKRVYRTGGADTIFQPINKLIDKVKLGNFYSNTNSYDWESTATIKVIDV